MPRTTAIDVAKLRTIPAAADTDTFILAANELTTECCTGAAGPATAYTDQRLELIERYLAAHFLTLSFPEAEQESAGSVQQIIRWKKGFNLEQTQYGQHAMMLDTNGGLARLQEQIEEGVPGKVGAWWLGKDADTELGLL